MKKLLLMAFAVASMFTAVAQSYPTNGLVAFYPMDRINIGRDESGNNFHATNTNTNAAADHYGTPNQASQFTGISSNYSRSFANNLSAIQNQSFSIAVWLKMEDLPNAYANIFELSDIAFLRFRRESETAWIIESGYQYNVDGFLDFHADDYSLTEQLYSSGTYKDNWVHLTFTSSLANGVRTQKLYLNGEYKDGDTALNSTIAYRAQDTLLQIGARPGTTVLSYKGVMHDYFIYNRELTISEIEQIYRVCDATTTEINYTKCPYEAYQFDGVWLTDAGTYSATYQSVNGCDSTVILNLSVNNYEMQATVADSVCTAPYFGSATYAWYPCDSEVAIEGANSYQYITTEPGSYVCQIFYAGCYYVSNCVEVVAQPVETGISEANKLNLSVYPNPSNGVFTISNNSGKLLNAKVLNSLGATVHQVSLAEGNQQINISALASGVYQLMVSDETNSIHQVQRLLKQ